MDPTQQTPQKIRSILKAKDLMEGFGDSARVECEWRGCVVVST